MLVTRYTRPTTRDRRYDMLNEFMKSFNDVKVSKEPEEMVDFVPAVNTREGKDAYHIDVDLPGIKKENVDVSVDNNVLKISGSREIKEEVKEEDYYKVESSYGTFSRSFTLPENVDIENIRAVSEDGVLEVIIPKFEVEKNSTKKIAVE